MKNITWHKLKERQERAGYRWITHKTFRMPDGKETDWTTIGKKGIEFVCVLPLTADLKVVCATQFRPGPEKICFELPGGIVDPGETPKLSIEREFQEETGYKGELIFLAALPMDGYSDIVRHHFLALNCKKVSEVVQHEDEFIHVEELAIDDFKNKLQAGLVTDTTTALLALKEAERREVIKP